MILGGWRAGVATVICLGGLLWLGLWNNSMITLTATLVAAIFVMLLAAMIGVWMGRSSKADSYIRPLLDAGQTLPPFVYLIPVLALFGPTRFTAIVAAVAYAAPAAIKIVADGIKAVSATTVEAAQSAGAVAIQIITKVQIPMSRSAFTVAANQGLLYVLSMVVIGGLVGAGALGYDVVAGFKQLDLAGPWPGGRVLDRAARRHARPDHDLRGPPRRGAVVMTSRRIAALVAVVGTILAMAAPGIGGNIKEAEAVTGKYVRRASTSRSTTGSATRPTRSWSARSPRSGWAAWSTTCTSTSRSPGRASPAARSTWCSRTGATPS